MEAADAFDRDDAARLQHTPCTRNRGMISLVTIQEKDTRAAIVAADGLRIVAARFSVRVLEATFVAHRKRPHACAFTVVGHSVEDREARATGCAVDEGMEVTTIIFVEKLCPTLRADGDVRGYEDIAALMGAFDDLEIRKR